MKNFKQKFNKITILLPLFLVILPALSTISCRTRREIVLAETQIANMSFDHTKLPEEMVREDEEEASFMLWNKTKNQSQCMLQLAPDAALRERFYRQHDLTIFSVSGHAIVKVEGIRHYMQPGMAVVVPRMHKFAIIPHETPGDVIAVMVYSPPFDGKETFIVE